MNRNRVNGVLLLLVLGLGTLIWFSDHESHPPASSPLTQLLPEQIRNIRISNQNGPAFSMKHDGNGWRMIQPYAIEANNALIMRLLEIAVSPVHTQFEISQSDLTEFGLTPPAALLYLDQLEIRIGSTEPINHYRYIGIGNSLYLIKDLFPHLLLAAAETYVSPNILPPGAEPNHIQTPTWQLARTPDIAQVWKLTPPVADISMDRLTEKVDEWKNAQALKVVKAPALSPDARVEIHLNGVATALSFGILKQQKSTLLIREDLGLAYELPHIDSLLSAPAALTKAP